MSAFDPKRTSELVPPMTVGLRSNSIPLRQSAKIEEQTTRMSPSSGGKSWLLLGTTMKSGPSIVAAYCLVEPLWLRQPLPLLHLLKSPRHSSNEHRHNNSRRLRARGRTFS